MEYKKEIKIEDKKSVVNLDSRKRLNLTGVLEVVSFNDEDIILNTALGTLKVSGDGLKMNKLDVQNGEVVVTGRVDCCIYTGSDKPKDKDSILAKLFK